ncbi:hypothetical protein [Paenibacillus xylaniclasticus]|uniref:hypothetical protein n=1 Tax=Paenibacillus xylaniclasticus TaxID=588083 RepID=UPI000FD8990A|nr:MULTISPECIES: hypothetical protein [Paenibacillus]GFN29950.1 hypothetical protein PCURB6_02100 [Paenibacillus curdlanolyticus]
MSEEQNIFNEDDLVAHLVEKTKVAEDKIRLVLKYEQAFIDKAHTNARGEVDIDSDELVDYILKQRDVKLDELAVESILDTEMQYLLDNGYAQYDE